MHEKTREFLESVCTCIKHRPIHKEICDELELHIKELQEEFMLKTQSEEDALDMAIAAMGDPAEIGERLNRQHKPQTEWSIIILSAVIALTGAAVNYASRNLEYGVVNWESYLFSAALGTMLMLFLYFFDYSKLKKLSWPFYLGSIFLVVLIGFSGLAVNGARRWLVIGGFLNVSITSIIVPLTIAFAGFMTSAKGKGSVSFFKISLLAAVPVFLMSQLMLSYSFILFVCFSAMIIIAVFKNHFGGKRLVQIISVGTAAGFFGLLSLWLVLFAFRGSARLEVFLSRGQSDPTGRGYQAVMADMWLAASNMFGAADTSSVSGHLPALTTDFALVNVFITLGRAAGILLVIIIALFIIRLFIISFKIKNTYGFYLSLSACMILTVQFAIGLLVNLSLFPTSAYIPFISYGGTGYVSSMLLIGLILSAWRRNNILPAPPESAAEDTKDFIQYSDGKLIIHLKK